jgi:hypothetical protein
MRGESDRDCRARGGTVNRKITPIKSFNDRGGEPIKAFEGGRSKNKPDATLKRGKGPLFRARGGSTAPDAMERRAYGGRSGHADGGAAFAEGGAVARKRGGAVEGDAVRKPHMGRAGRKGGGSVGSDKRPLTSAALPKKPKGRHIMPRTEATP